MNFPEVLQDGNRCITILYKITQNTFTEILSEVLGWQSCLEQPKYGMSEI